jgi:hypothetical protein
LPTEALRRPGNLGPDRIGRPGYIIRNFAKFPQRLPELLPEFREFLGSKQDQRDNEDDRQIRGTDTECQWF